MWTENFQIFLLDLEKSEEPKSNCQHLLDHRKNKRITEKKKKSTSVSLTMSKSLTVCITTNCRKFLSRWEYRPPAITCFLQDLYTGQQEATVRTGHGTKDWFQIGKRVCQGFILSPCLFNCYAEYIMQNVGLDEAQAGIKIAGRNINNLRYADVTTLMAERGTKDPPDVGERG